MNTHIVHFLNEKHRKDLVLIYQEAWWTCGRTLQDVDTILENSSFYIGILDQETDQLIGFARVMTDSFKFAFILDVIVLKAYRGHGFGKRLVEIIMNHPSLQNLYIHLVCEKTMMPFYHPFGFTEDYENLTAMRLRRPAKEQAGVR